jgi:peptidoglycan/xylan/chitin deacetylase (PgdA/CDA1 family)
MTLASHRTVPVLLYHSVCTEPAPLMREWAISPARFREHLAFLTREGYETLTVTDYVALLDTPGTPLPERLAVVTFDDGFADFATNAAPALVDAGIAATLYVSTAYVGGASSWLGPDGEQPMLTWDGIAEVAALGVEIGAHAHHHWPLDELDAHCAEMEISVSKRLLERHLGRAVTSFAYPHGYHTRRIKDTVRRAGYTNACGVKEALSGPGDDGFGLARIMIHGDAPVEQLDSLMRGARAPRHEAVQTKAWRAARRARARLRPTPRTRPLEAMSPDAP